MSLRNQKDRQGAGENWTGTDCHSSSFPSSYLCPDSYFHHPCNIHKPQLIGHLKLGSLSALGQRSSFDAATTADLVMFVLKAISLCLFTRVLEMNGVPSHTPETPHASIILNPAALVRLKRCLNNK